MSKLGLKMKKVGRGAKNAIAVVVATVAAVATAEAAFVGAEMMQNDAQFVGNKVKDKIDKREPVYYREGRFGKKQIGVIGKDGKVKPYNGSKVPASKKAVRV